MNNPTTEKTITLPISRFIEYLIGSADKRYRVHPDDATVLALKDNDEVFAHVELPNKDNQLEMPCVWKAREWKLTYEKRERDKANAARERLAANIFRENVEKVARRLAILSSLDIETVRGTAIIMVRKGDRAALIKLGINIEEWDKNINTSYIQ